MWVTVVFLIILVQIIQLVFNWLSKRIDKRLDQTAQELRSSELLPLCPHQVNSTVFTACLFGIPASV